MVDIIGKEKIIQYINRYRIRKIKLTKGTDTIYLDSITPDQSQSDLIDRFSDWVDDFIAPTNFQNYKLELFGSNNTNPDAKLSSVVKVGIQFNVRDMGMGAIREPQSKNIDVDKYIGLAVENAELKSQLASMESKLDELLADDDDDETDETPMGSIQDLLMSKMDGILDVIITQFGSKMMAQPINGTGIDTETEKAIELIEEFQKFNPQIVSDLAKLLNLAKTKPQFFNMLISQLRNM